MKQKIPVFYPPPKHTAMDMKFLKMNLIWYPPPLNEESKALFVFCS